MKLLFRILISLSLFIFFSCQSRLTTRLESKDSSIEEDSYKEYLSEAIGAVQIKPLDKDLEKQNKLKYYSKIVGDQQIAQIILDQSERNDISPELAFALAFAESSFNKRAVNYNSHSIDRGLFQLNNRSFPNLKEEDFFNPEINIRLGIEYLKHCLSLGGDEVTALAMYNAGPNRVKDSRTPQMTLKYISKIQNYKKMFQNESQEERVLVAEIESPSFKSIKNPRVLIDQIDKIN